MRERLTTFVVIIMLVFGVSWIGAAIITEYVNTDPLEQKLEQQQQILSENQQNLNDLKDRMETLESDMLQILQQLNRILGAGDFLATAYTHAAPGGDVNGTGNGLTATGIPVYEGTVAVDPNIIPLGSKVWVEGFGVMIAADTGGNIKGNRIDIFMENRQRAKNYRDWLRCVWY